MIDTSKVPIGEGGRRSLRFETVEAMVRDARACAVARTLTRRGNWTIGQALNHIAAWIDYPFVGYPAELVIPEEMKAQARDAKGRIMSAAMHPGDRIPRLAAGTLATEVVPTEIGVARFEAAAKRLASGGPGDPLPVPDPAFGVVTRGEWTAMSLRHAELHLSFFVPSV